MEPFAALGVACNILQLTGSAQQIISSCKRIYESGSSEPELAENAASIASLADTAVAQCASPCSPKEKELHDVAKRCSKAAVELKDEVRRCTAQGNGLASTLRATVKTVWRRRKLERLEKVFVDSQKTLDTTFLAEICSRAEANQRLAEGAFKNLTQGQQRLISAYAAGHSRLYDLVQAESLTIQNVIKDHILSVRSSADEALASKLKLLQMETTRDDKRRCLLASLKFSSMNERRNHVSDTDHDTFRWIFETSTPLFSLAERPPWPSFSQWLEAKPEAEAPLYWISGKPGSGKSTLFKFIVSSVEQTALLEPSQANSQPKTILSHYMWRAGSEMQQSIKGLLCALLHQILSEPSNLELLDVVANTSSAKDSNSDWSVQELRNALFQILPSLPGVVYVFLDGLDEVSMKDGVSSLLDFVDRLNSLPNTKLCVSSRPEPHLFRRLAKQPTLKLQDLTAEDIHNYIKASLKVPSDHSYAYAIQHLALKSQGVFLWARLALRSVQSGIDNEDTLEEIMARIDALPSEMDSLYQDMWRRLNDDRIIYRQSAGLFFNLVMAAQAVPYANTKSSASRIRNDDVSVFELALAYHNVPWDEEIAVEGLREMCEVTRKQVDVRCAGLLEVVTMSTGKIESSLWLATDGLYQNGYKSESLLPYVCTAVRFIHRTARDFLDTDSGLEILSYDTHDLGSRFLRLYNATLHWERIARSWQPLCRLMGLGPHMGHEVHVIYKAQALIPHDTVMQALDILESCGVLVEAQQQPPTQDATSNDVFTRLIDSVAADPTIPEFLGAPPTSIKKFTIELFEEKREKE
ncbi:hypothetical protein B0T25DRAFT_567408 [Lasiosphaeria hispida]|uniref:NACHT domain-containing protein n=1 Tax=Lasiosphaeria hispida TaxID=260671 RepID=A0AAJ0HNU8_9PEZI|nr:hypothetical protein B0T25DRAFT_567408 [Lasiosphaeria hispida]